jgi:hypothetical protein
MLSYLQWEANLLEQVEAARKSHAACKGKDPIVSRRLEESLKRFCDFLYYRKLPEPASAQSIHPSQ